jgi:hypothetical protein
MSTYTQADLIAIAKLMQEHKIDEILASQNQTDSKNEAGSQQPQEPPKPSKIPDSATGPTPAKPESDQKDLDSLKGNPRPTTNLEAFDILDACSRVSFTKELDHEVSTYLPNSHRMYAILHEIDDILVQNRYFRQNIPSFLPTQSRIYMGIIFLMHTYRCMIHAGLPIDVITRATIDQFFVNHPVETLPIPGPLIPVLQAICVSNPQDATLPRVCPRLPQQLGPRQASDLIQSPVNFAIPNIPMLFGLHATIRAYVNAHAGDTAETILTAFGIDNDSTQEIVLNGTTFPVAFAGGAAPLTARQKWSVTCPGIGQPFELNQELLANFKNNARYVTFPPLQAATSVSTIAEFTRISTGNWFPTLKRNMAIYCRYIKASGTLQDIKVEGPASAQIISNLITQGVAEPTGFFRLDRLLPGDATYTTAMSANDRLAEITSVYSQIHARITGHPLDWYNRIGEEDINNGRNGTFWSKTPLFPATAPDHFKDSLGAEVSRYVRERADKD